MGLWKIWLVGLVLTIVTSILIYTKRKIHKFFIDLLVIFDIILVGGIAEGWAIAFLYNACGEKTTPMFLVVILSLLAAVLIWVVGAPTLAIIKEKQFRISEIVIFVLVFIIASLCWAQPFINYNNNYETIEKTIVIKKQEDQLLYFCKIPVQQVSGSISGDVSGFIVVDGEISGSISTSEELPYWYMDKNGDGRYNSVPTKNSKIRYIKPNEKTYVETITYQKQTIRINHNNGKEEIITQNEWKEYTFYLPETIMQYKLE